MRILREKRQYEARKELESSREVLLLDIGSNSYSISNFAVKLDIDKTQNIDVCATVFRIPFPNSVFDVVALLEVLEHFNRENQEKVLLEIKRILKTKAKLIISIPNYSPYLRLIQDIIWFTREHTTQRHYHANALTHAHVGNLSPNEIRNLLEANEFRIIKEKRVCIYDYLIVAEKR